MEYALVLLGAYLLGSISWGLIVGRLVRDVDVRHYGSGTTGVTNVLRTLGLQMAGIVLLADVSKGIAAVLLARLLSEDPLAEALAGILVILGHNWPIFSRFHGGRGVTAAVGGLMVMAPLAAVAAAVAFLLAILASRYVSLGSVLSVLVAMVSIPILVMTNLEPWQYMIYVGAGGPVILWRHRGNIQRIFQGTERRLGQSEASNTRTDPH